MEREVQPFCAHWVLRLGRIDNSHQWEWNGIRIFVIVEFQSWCFFRVTKNSKKDIIALIFQQWYFILVYLHWPILHYYYSSKMVDKHLNNTSVFWYLKLIHLIAPNNPEWIIEQAWAVHVSTKPVAQLAHPRSTNRPSSLIDGLCRFVTAGSSIRFPI